MSDKESSWNKLTIGGIELSATPVLSTSGDDHVPDIGPGMAERRSKALDADAQAPTAQPAAATEPTDSERQADADMTEAIVEANEKLAGKGEP